VLKSSEIFEASILPGKWDELAKEIDIPLDFKEARGPPGKVLLHTDT